MNCARCNKDLGHADDKNADYVIADDGIIIEPREVYVNTEVKAESLGKPPAELTEDDLTTYETLFARDALLRPNAIKTQLIVKDFPVQKTLLVCPECYRDTDFIIWGVHKVKAVHESKPVNK